MCVYFSRFVTGSSIYCWQACVYISVDLLQGHQYTVGRHVCVYISVDLLQGHQYTVGRHVCVYISAWKCYRLWQ